jgi:hypothetical protein
MFRKFFLFCFLAALLFGCVNYRPLVTTLRDPSIPKEKHAVLSLDYTMMSVRVDGQNIASGGGGGLNYKSPIILLPSGKHAITARYQRDTSAPGTTSIEYSGDMSIEFVFDPGRFYLLYPAFNGNKVQLEVVDETDPFVWDASQERGRAQLRVDTAREEIRKLK